MRNLLYLSPVPWRSFSQRPHRLARWFHGRTGGRVLWVDPYPTRFPRWADFRRPKVAVEGAGAPAWLEVAFPPALPLEPLARLRGVNRWLWRPLLTRAERFLSDGRGVVGVGKPSDLAVQILDRARGAPSFYDAMDDVAWFYEGRSRASMARQEIAVAVRVDRVWAASSALERRWRRGARFCVRVPNACAPEDLPSPGARPPARDRRAFGYVGTLARWFDWDFTRAVAEAFPDRPVDLIGPMYERPSGRLPDNVRLHPPRAAREALAAMGRFAVGLIPFRAGPLTEAADPVKYYEYAALGLPVLSTRVGEMARREGCPGVFLAEGPAEAAVRAREALAATPVEDLRAFQAVHSWEARFDAAGLFS